METPEYFNICVNILEATELPYSNISSLVCVEIHKEKKCTKIVKNSAKPFYNEYFVFELEFSFSDLMSAVIVFKVFDKKTVIRRLVGCVSLEGATVWIQPDHRLRSWLAITVPSDPAAHVNGILNCEIAIKTSDNNRIYPKISSWVSPGMLGGRRMRYIVRFYDCVGLKAKQQDELCEVLLKTTFAGKTGSTTPRLYRKTVEWNEQITFLGFYPPLFQKITIDLHFSKKMLASRCFYLSDISSPSPGYLPTYGPTYVHFYVEEYIYCASVFMSIETEYALVLKPQETTHGITLLPAKPLKKESYGRIERFLCYGVLFDSVVLDKTLAQPNDDIDMSIEFGRTSDSEAEDNDDPENRLDTPKFRAKEGNSDFVYLPIEQHKPCVFIRSSWPNTHFRLTNSNILSKVAQNLRNVISTAKDLITKGQEEEAIKTLKRCVGEFKIAHNIISRQVLYGVNSLDVERIQLLSSVLNKLSSMKVRKSNLESFLDNCQSFITFLDFSCEDIQESLPNIVIYLKRSNTAIGYCKLNPREIFFSKTELKKGISCGKIVTHFVRNLNQIKVGRIDIWLWLGFEDLVSFCLQLLPPGYESTEAITSLPTTLTYTTNEMYSAVCYVFGGLITNKLDSRDLCNPSVRIYLSNQSRETCGMTRTLAPLWKETLTFSEIRLYSTPEFVQDNPPLLSLEMWDQSTKPPSLMGTTFVVPNVRLHPISTKNEYELQWFELDSQSKILAVFDLIQMGYEDKTGDTSSRRRPSKLLPTFVEPPTVSYRIEVVFWGIRPIDLKGLNSIQRTQAILQWGSAEIKSSFVKGANTTANFQHQLQIFQVELPDIEFYAPPILLHIISTTKYMGFCVDNNVNHYVYKLATQLQWDALTTSRKSAVDRARGRRTTLMTNMPDLIPLKDIDDSRWSYEIESHLSRFKRKFIPLHSLFLPFQKLYVFFKRCTTKYERMSYEEVTECEDFDWWYKYYTGRVVKYDNELESQPDFCGFNDVFKTFIVKHRQKIGMLKRIAKIKALVSLYQWPAQDPRVTLQGKDPVLGVYKHLAFRDQVTVLVRVYCVQAHNLQPCDIGGKSDPYIEIETPSCVVSDKSNYIPRQLNPVFGKCFQITANFPVDSILVIRIMDWDRFTFHDLIGETVIDIENRFYSKFRASCGLPSVFKSEGHNKWRDMEPPSVILERLCYSYNLPLPQYLGKTVLVGSKEFVIDHKSEDEAETVERLALMALHKWNEIPVVGHVLVPEHVETRSLFHKDRPGIERGKLEMWVDIFDLSLGPVPAPVDITPRKPQEYELRVIIWNTSKVPLVDDSYFVGRKHTDIYVKGWLGDKDSTQSTDVHYTSINGDGNFNWRFKFPFQFLRLENKMVILKKDLLEFGKTEYKVPPHLTLQVWDSDRISADDFIGSMVFDLNFMPRGARSRRGCKVYNTLTPQNPVDIFKVKRMRGWWPFLFSADRKPPSSAGFLEAEFQLLTSAEALISPAGLGRAGPAALSPPIRPEFQIRFWLAPLRIITHFIFGVHREKVIFCSLFVVIVVFVLVAIYSLPVFLVKKIIGA